ncbi:Hypothetical predicted protein [Octopus vulgaris]|uniref:Uncharacterized protein n=1 Tax=Octopus vulgaris TaxID=6645 RepID=A0AA36B282_OCTVU|nr:Hypothetical predicted protein [Octopus vulgaris]
MSINLSIPITTCGPNKLLFCRENILRLTAVPDTHFECIHCSDYLIELLKTIGADTLGEHEGDKIHNSLTYNEKAVKKMSQKILQGHVNVVSRSPNIMSSYHR